MVGGMKAIIKSGKVDEKKGRLISTDIKKILQEYPPELSISLEKTGNLLLQITVEATKKQRVIVEEVYERIGIYACYQSSYKDDWWMDFFGTIGFGVSGIDAFNKKAELEKVEEKSDGNIIESKEIVHNVNVSLFDLPVTLDCGPAGQYTLRTDERGSAELNLEPLLNRLTRNYNWKITASANYEGLSTSDSLTFNTSSLATSNIQAPIKKPAKLITTASFKDHTGDGVLEGLENGKVVVVVKNTGIGKAYDVKVKLDVLGNKIGLHIKREFLLGNIPSGRKVKKAIDVSGDKTILPGLTRIKLETVEALGFDAEPVIVAFRTSKFKPPKLIIADTGISDFNDNAKVEPQEIIDVTVRIQNVGVGKAEDIKAKVVHGGNVFIIPETPQFDLGDLKPGQHKDIKFKFFTNKRIKNGERIPIEVALSEKRSGLSTKKPLNMIMAKAQKRIREILTESKEKEAPEIKIAKGLTIDVDMNIPEGRHIAGKDDIAVVIANKNYDRASRVKFAIHDGRIIREYLVKTIGFREGNIIYKEDAHLGDFNTIFGKRGNPKGKLYNYVEPNSRIFIYYAGHGAPDPGSGSAFFVPVEADPQYVVNSGYSLDTLKENLGKLRAKDITIVLDCCFSGGSAKGELIKGISPAALQLKDIYAAPGNMTMLLSAKANQVSSWYPEKRHSLFTYYFLKGLQGKADKNGDKRITVTEMKTYLKNNIPRMARRLNNIDQTPVVSGKEDKVLAVLK